MIAAADFLKRSGAQRIEAAAVHPVMSGQAKTRLDDSAIERIVVTDTIPIAAERRSSKVSAISVAKLFADAIYAIHHGESISDLFR